MWINRVIKRIKMIWLCPNIRCKSLVYWNLNIHDQESVWTRCDHFFTIYNIDVSFMHWSHIISMYFVWAVISQRLIIMWSLYSTSLWIITLNTMYYWKIENHSTFWVFKLICKNVVPPGALLFNSLVHWHIMDKILV